MKLKIKSKLKKKTCFLFKWVILQCCYLLEILLQKFVVYITNTSW